MFTLELGMKIGELTITAVRSNDVYECVCSCGRRCFRKKSSLRNVDVSRCTPKCKACFKGTRAKKGSRRGLAAGKEHREKGDALGLAEFEKTTGGTKSENTREPLGPRTT
jgi:hypothetical protein